MDKDDFVNHIMYTDCERCPIQIYCSFKSPQYTTCEDVGAYLYVSGGHLSPPRGHSDSPRLVYGVLVMCTPPVTDSVHGTETDRRPLLAHSVCD